MPIFETAAAVVGVVGVGFQCLAGCIQGFQLISTAFQVGKQTIQYRCALILEEERLLSWAKWSGLANNKLDRRLNEAVIVQVLSSLHDLLTSTEKLGKRYKLKVHVDDAVPTPGPQYDSLSGEDLSFLESDALTTMRARLLQEAKKIQKDVPFKRFRFAAVDKAEFKELLSDIRGLIQSLVDLLDGHVQNDILLELRMERSNTLQLISELKSLRTLIEAYNLGDVGTIPEKTLTLLRAVELAPNAASTDKDELQSLMDEAAQSKHISLVHLFGDRIKDTTPMGPSSLRGSATYDGKAHYVEWKRYDWGTSTESQRRIQDSIANLAVLLNAPKHPAFRTLQCVGIIDEPHPHRYMYMYQWPVSAEHPAPPKSLHDLLSSSYKPSLTVRVRLARQLVHALFYLHLSNWMHKSFSSHNVLFFPPSAKAPRTLEDPYIVGFTYSRQDAAGEPSEALDRDPDSDIYRHPDCLAENYGGFRKSYDVYSLGLVLVEIAKWRPLKEIFLRSARAKALTALKKTEKEMTRKELSALDETLLRECKVQDIIRMREDLSDETTKDSHPVDIAFRAGERLMEIVMTCLGDRMDEARRSEIDRAYENAFFQDILRPLERMDM
ncbi:prion-inhibition and propagation-domain-containing protein [Paraphoma chrysanthemicola]|uniref:Prion-inhibition and propagation-domain-containing protein n=1 Tax=Paraphoma chrysanthemicola TaxID=798071 RepID=A0A8K0R6B8_9PLEO|nr:prion-inhibition and propagation-domain-containing protein [Paraphoma chrysanthemicola]